MPTTHFSRRLRDRLEKMVEERSEAVSYGGCADFSVYKFDTGHINGLRTAISLIEEIEQEDN